MNATFFLKKAPIVFLVLLSFAIFDSAEAGRIRLKKVKSQIAPRHISLSIRTGNGVYARRYGYGRPIPHYSTKGLTGKNRRYYTRKNGRRNLSRTYASRYKNWTNFQGGRKDSRIDRVGGKKRRKELYPFLKEPPLKPKRRNRPHGLTAMQRPRPPKKPNEFDEEYFFPEEAKRAEAKFEFENRYPRPKKKRRPDFEPDFASFYDEKPYKAKPAYSYSSFVQHPSGSSEDLYDDPENIYQPGRSKKKKVKKKSNSRKKNKEPFKPFIFENDQPVDNYPPYSTGDEYELPSKTYKKRNKPSYTAGDDEDEFIPSSSFSKPRPQVSLFSSDSDFRGSQNSYQSAQFNPTYSHTWSQVVTTTARPAQYQTDSGFQPQYISGQYNYNQQKTKQTPQQTPYYSQPDTSYRNTLYSSQQSPTNFNPYPSQPSSSPTLTDITIQKSVPVYDNTETFYNFNNNAYVNSQSSKYYSGESGGKYYDKDGNPNYGSKVSTYRNKLGETTDSENEFIKKHQNLYNKGLTGVPVQGDGYTRESVKKDYDIGYGDFQFVENPTS